MITVSCLLFIIIIIIIIKYIYIAQNRVMQLMRSVLYLLIFALLVKVNKVQIPTAKKWNVNLIAQPNLNVNLWKQIYVS